MAFQSVPNTAQIDIVYTLNNKPVQNVMYAEHPGGYNLADLEALAAAVDAAVGANWFPEQPQEASYVRTETRGLEEENDLTASDNSSAGAGSATSATLPGQVTYSIKKVSGLTGRSARGRLYWIGVPRGFLDTADENFISQAYSTNVIANVEAVRVAINGEGTWEAKLVSRFSNNVKRAFGVTFDWVGVTAVDLRLDTLRGRLP